MKYIKMKYVSYNLLHIKGFLPHFIGVLLKAFKIKYGEISYLDHIKNK